MKADTNLLDAAKKMDAAALIEIFDLYATALYKYAICLCADELMADQIVGDVFAKLLEHLSAGKGPSTNLRSYLFQMTYHTFLDEARYSHHRVSLEVVDFFRYDGNFGFLSVENRILFETISQAIRNDLTNDQRHVIILRFLEGFSLKETAAIMGKEVGNVKVIQNRAIATLREAVGYPLVETGAISPNVSVGSNVLTSESPAI
jgi:RNA polymerase sigma-70 factor, ECF subfamily